MSTVVIMAGTNRSCVFVSILLSAEVETEEEIQLGFDPSVQTTIGEPNTTTIVIASDGSKPLKLTGRIQLTLFTHSFCLTNRKSPQ